MPFGDFFSKLDYIQLTTADDREFLVRNAALSKLAFRMMGVPHIGVRLRSRKILKNVPKKFEKMLDAGYGTGIYSFSLSPRASLIEAVDIEPKKLDYVSKVNPLKNINFQIGDLTNLKFSKENFNLIICSEVLEHIKNDKKAFSELIRVLSKNGKLIVTVPYDSNKNRVDFKKYGHERPGYNLKIMEEMCEKNGAKILDCELYSYSATEKMFEINSKTFSNKILLGLLFYPLYLISLFTDKFLKIDEPNGIFFVIVKK